MDAICEECGDAGFKDLLLHCSNCRNAARHRYCLDAVIYESIVEWLCNDCLPKHNEAIKSLEDVSNQRQLRDTQLGSSIINESNVRKKKVTKGLWSWGHRRNRSREARKDRSDASTKHFLSGDTFNWGHRVNRSHNTRRDSDASTKQFRSGDALNSCEMFIGEMSERNDSEKKGEDRNEHSICALGSVDGSSHSALDYTSEIEEHNHFHDPMGKPTLNSMECSDLSKEKDSCSSSSKYVEGSIPQERSSDIFSLINDVERSHPIIADKSRPTLASVEQADGSSPTLASMEKSYPLKAVKGLVYKQKSVLASKFPPNHSKPMQGSDLKTGNAEALNPSKECMDSWSKVAEPSSPSNEREDSIVEKDSAERTKCVADEEIVIRTLENRTGSNPSMAKECLVSNEACESLSSKYVSPCESIKLNPRKRHNQSNSQTPHETKYQKAKLIKKNKTVYDARSKSKEALRTAKLNRRSSKNHEQVKKQRSIEANGDENAVGGDLDPGCAQNVVSQLALQTVVTEDHCGLSRMPLISEYICVQPIDKPYWTGIMKIDGDYIPLAAHLSTKAGKKVQELSRSLPPIMKVMKLSMLKAWPKCLEAPKPTADSIGLYFFSGDMRPNKELDRLVKHVADSSIVLETVVGLTKLLLFPSVVLPEEYQTFQGKHYLWGVFKPRKDRSKRLAPVDCTAHVTEEEQIQEQHVLDQQDKAQRDTLDQEKPVVNQVVHSENEPLPDANRDVGKEALSASAEMKARVPANISPADHGQPCSNPEAPPLKLCGFVISRTPRSAQLIQEMQKEGALLFAVQQVLTEPGSVL